VMLYLVVVVIAAVRYGQNPAVWASLLSVLAFNLVFVPPYYTLTVAEAEYLLTFVSLLGVGVVISTLTARALVQEQAARQRERQTAALYALSRQLSGAIDLPQVAQIIVAQTSLTFKGHSALYLLVNERLELFQASAAFEPTAQDEAAVQRCFEGDSGGNGHGRLLQTGRMIVGVLLQLPVDKIGSLTPDQEQLLDSFASQAALAIERSQLAQEAQEAQLLAETEKLQAALLNSISHDLRTPLASITGSLSSLRNDRHLLSEAAQQELIRNAAQEANRLNQLVANLLDMTRLEGGHMQLNLQLVDVQDLLGVAFMQLDERLTGREVEIVLPDDLPPIEVDFSLMVQVFVNLLDNAHKYSAAERPIAVTSHIEHQGEVRIAVSDYGVGIPAAEIDRIFEKFYRITQWNDISGTGLGLSISKGIVEAHNGRIWAQNRPEGEGTIVTVALPAAAVHRLEREEIVSETATLERHN
ncbi:MAG: DUF4118 domain-containing protein, partial [Anaerolineales bacterium]|nr:DUF4118 domain-containing protein [Anaerolineales bacterium]